MQPHLLQTFKRLLQWFASGLLPLKRSLVMDVHLLLVFKRF